MRKAIHSAKNSRAQMFRLFRLPGLRWSVRAVESPSTLPPEVMKLVGDLFAGGNSPQRIVRMLDAVEDCHELWLDIGQPFFVDKFQVVDFLSMATAADPYFKSLTVGHYKIHALAYRDKARLRWASVASKMNSAWGFCRAFARHEDSMTQGWPRPDEPGYVTLVKDRAQRFDRDLIARQIPTGPLTDVATITNSRSDRITNPTFVDEIDDYRCRYMRLFELQAAVVGVPPAVLHIALSHPSTGTAMVEAFKYFDQLWRDEGAPKFADATETLSFLAYGLREEGMLMRQSSQDRLSGVALRRFKDITRLATILFEFPNATQFVTELVKYEPDASLSIDMDAGSFWNQLAIVERPYRSQKTAQALKALD